MLPLLAALATHAALAMPMAGASPLCEALLTEPFDERAVAPCGWCE